MSVIQLAPGKRLSLEDIVRVAKGTATVAIEEAVILQVAAANLSLSPSSAEAAQVDIASVTEYSASYVPITRAGLVVRLNALLSSRSLSANTINTLVAVLNSNITPLGNDNNVLIAFLSASGSAISADGSVQGANVLLPSVAPADFKLSASEAKVLATNSLLTIGEACLAVSGAVNLLKGVDGVVAFSAEASALKRIDVFDPTLYETNRPHRGMMTSASNLKILLEGSKAVGVVGNPKAPQGASSRDIESIYAAPQSTGPCLDTLVSLAKTLETEVNAIETNQVPTVAQQGSAIADLALQSVTSLCNLLNDASVKRVQEIYNVEATPAVSSASGYAAVVALADQLAAEVGRAHAQLQEKEAALVKPAAETAAADDEDSTPGAGKKAGAGKGKEEKELDMSGMSADQIAKIEAKRKAKADKAAQKAKEKEQRRAAGIVLGQGTTLLRALVANNANVASLFDPWYQTPVDSSSSVASNAFWQETQRVLETLSSQGGRRRPKIAKGTRDFTPDQMRIREQAFGVIRQVFKRHGGVEIDTPVFELKEVLMGKYGEDSKLIYDLADQGGELLSLRYDLTVPFARFLAMNTVGNIKRYHIAKVYRRDQPVLSRGRYREFYQCDFDIAGVYAPMTADAEVITVLTEILSTLPVGDFVVKLNHRQILDAVFELCGVPAEKFRPICSAVDKLDKATWEEVQREMVEEKGLAPEVAAKIGTYVLKKGDPMALLQALREQQVFGDHAGANHALAELALLFTYLEAMGSLQYVSFDLSLARGLDYYTGVIYEVVLVEAPASGNNPPVSVGSIAAGGRYDNLVGMFSVGGVQTPCVGGSIGVERVFTIMERKAEQMKLLQQQSAIQVYVASIGAGLLPQRMAVARRLWTANLSAEYSHLDNPKFKKQLDEALERFIPFMVVFGEEEVTRGTVKVKNMRAKTEVEVTLDNLVEHLLADGCVPVQCGADVSLLTAMKNFSLGASASAAAVNEA